MVDWRNYTDESEIIDLIPDYHEYELKTGEKVKASLTDDDGRIITKNLPIEVPLSYCKLREYEGGKEALFCFGHGVTVGGHTFKPPVLGVMSMLEMTNNPFPVDVTQCTVIQQMHFLYFLDVRADALPHVSDHMANDVEFDEDDPSTWSSLDVAAVDHYNRLSKKGFDIANLDHWIPIIGMMSHSSNGFEMVPGEGGGSKFWYCAETIGSFIAGLGNDLNVSYMEIIWNVPMITVGFTFAAKSRANGTKGVKRPYDTEDVRRQMILAYLRELHGELHPWQEKNPDGSKLTQLQERHPALIKKFEGMQKDG